MIRTDLWPDADIAKLRELAATGMSTAAIGASMGRTKSAIVGKMGRLGISYGHPKNGSVALGNMMAKVRGSDPQKRRSTTAPARQATKRINRGACAKSERRSAFGEAPEPVPATAIGIFELTENTCRWPLWNNDTPAHQRVYCGGKNIEGLPYCGAHCRIAYTGPERSTLPTRHSPICEAAQ
jgi:GcrA cell cycle regulator